MARTLDQLRAADAWRRAMNCDEAYTRLAKGLPALIMNSGLMQTIAYLESKGGSEHARLGRDLREWLATRFPRRFASYEFRSFMDAGMECEPLEFQQITAEALAWLAWLRQIAPAVTREKQG